MPSNKIFAVLLVCGGAVLATLILSLHVDASKLTLKSPGSILATTFSGSKGGVGGDWKKILTSTQDGQVTSVVKNDQQVASYPNEGTLTDTMAKDFFSRYLIAKKADGQITTETADQIAQDTLASQNYTTAVGTQYTIKDLHIASQKDSATNEKYKTNIQQALLKRSPPRSNSVAVIMQKAITSENEKDLAPLDPIIASSRDLVTDLLSMTVPQDAVVVHLAFLNAMSNIEANTEAMRQVFTDPVKSFAAVAVYDTHTQDLILSMQNLSAYLRSKN